MWIFSKGQPKALLWKAHPVSAREKVEAHPNTGFTTILALSENPPSTSEGGYVSDAAVYQGPFYLDIDSSEISKSIAAFNEVIAKLLTTGLSPSAIACWVSGKKGFHIVIHEECFSDGSAIKKLPMVYRIMARKLALLKIECVDNGVYSCGRGRMWRVENKKRIDNGKYKVRLTESELRNMSEELYASISSLPREASPPLVVEYNSLLSALFHDAVGLAAEYTAPKPVFIDTTITDKLDGHLPPCLDQLRLGQNIKKTDFNAVSLQFAKGAAAFSGKQASNDIHEFATNYSVETSYTTPERRNTHCSQAFNIARNNRSYEWSCKSMRTVLETSPCHTCPIAYIQEDEDEPMVDEVVEMEVPAVEDQPKPKKSRKKEAPKDLGHNKESLMVVDDCYGFMVDGRFRRVCNFVFDLTRQYIEYVPNQERDVRVAVAGSLLIEGRSVGQIIIEESGWSKPNMISNLAGLGNAAFFGSDGDVQRMKSVLMENLEDRVTSIRRVNSFGIHRNEVDGVDQYTYVEPGWSINKNGQTDLCTYSGKPAAFPCLKNVALVDDSNREGISKALQLLLNINEPYRVGLLLGWFMAAFLQEHILRNRPEWPLISLHGEPGSGKTSTACVFAALHGVDYRNRFSPVNLPGSTPYVVWSFIGEATTVPRIFEEYNKARMVKNFELFGENFKQCWNKQAVSRGTIRGDKIHGVNHIGANAVQIPMSGPVVLCSEQELTMPSLVDRTVQIRFTKASKNSKLYEDSYRALEPLLLDLRPFAKLAYGEAINKTTESAWEMLREAEFNVPKAITERPRHSYSVCFLGLAFIKELDAKHNLGLAKDLSRVTSELIEWLDRNSSGISQAKRVSEVDLIMLKMNTMAAMTSSGSQLKFLEKDKHYRIEGRTMLLDSVVAHGMYISYTNRMEHSRPVIEQYKEFVSLMQGERYYMEEHSDSTFADGRSAMRLNLDTMMLKGIQVTGFKA